MRKFNRHQPRSLRFRLLLVVAGALLLAGAFVPRTHADTLAYWNFDDSEPPVGHVSFDSDAPTVFGNSLTLGFFGAGPPYVFPDVRTDSPGLDQNSITGPSVFGMGLAGSGAHSPVELRFAMPAGVLFTGMTFSFAINRVGNGFTLAALEFGIAGVNGPMTMITPLTFLVDGAVTVLSAEVPAAANNQPNLAFGILLTGGQSNGNNLQNVVDNILITGTIVPEPATIAGGLLGVLGLCWQQRRRLIRALRLRKT